MYVSRVHLQNRDAQIQQLLTDMKAQEEKHKRELDAMRQQVWRQVEEAREEALSQGESLDYMLPVCIDVYLYIRDRVRAHTRSCMKTRSGFRISKWQTEAGG